MACAALPSDGSKIALLRLLPCIFPVIFICAAVTGSVSVLYAAVALHLIILGAENTIGRFLANKPIAPLLRGSTVFEDACLLAWPVFHLSALTAALYLVAHSEPTARQTFAIGAIFAYSINVFSATVGHELIHRQSRLARMCVDVLYAAMLYPHFPAVHQASHHRWAGSSRDCQTPRPGQPIYTYLARALIGGLSIAPSAHAAALDPHLRWRALASLIGIAVFGLLGAPSAMMFLVVQGLFSFILVETLNYIQHYRPSSAEGLSRVQETGPVNQDLNFVSRSVLFNLPLHASHHANQNIHYSHLVPVSSAPSYCWGYWTAFWVAWVPPLWHYLHDCMGERAIRS